MEKYSLCRHEGIKPIWDGKGLNRLGFCPKCGQPIIKNVLAVIAYLKKPRYLRNGEVVEKKLSREQVINFICDHAKIIAYGEVKPPGRPRKQHEKPRYLEGEEDWFVFGMPVSYRKMIRDYVLWRQQVPKCLEVMGLRLMGIIDDLYRKRVKEGKEPLPFPLQDLTDIIFVFCKVLQPLKESELRALYANFLIKKGYPWNVLRLFGIGSPATVQKWRKWSEEILKKASYYKLMKILPKKQREKVLVPIYRDGKKLGVALVDPVYPHEFFYKVMLSFAKSYQIPII